MKKKNKITIKDRYQYLSSLFLAIIYIFLLYQLTNSFILPTRTESPEINLSEYPEPNLIQIDNIQEKELKKLPSNYEDFLNTYDLELTSKDITKILNYGYTYMPITNSDNSYIDIYNEYQNLSTKSKEIHISSDSILHLLKYKYKEIKNTVTKTQGTDTVYLAPNLTERKAIETDVKIYIENDIENYTYLQNHIEYLSQYFSQFNSLKQEIASIMTYIEMGEESSEEIKSEVREILRNMPNFQPCDNKIFVYTISVENDSLEISPEIISKESIIAINDKNFSSEYDIEPVIQPNGSVRIPVLMFHQIETPPENASQFKTGLYISPEIFEEQIAYLSKKNYKSLTTEEFFQILETGKNPDQKSVVLTFDDAVESHYKNAYPILKKYKYTGVFFVPSSRSSISGVQLKEMSDNGMDIQSHSATHPDLSKITDTSTLQSEIGGSKSALQSITGKSVNSFAYPGCAGNTPTFNTVASSGYLTGFSCGKTIDHYSNKRLSLARRHVSNELEYFKKILSGIF